MRRWRKRALLGCAVGAAGTIALSDQARAVLGVGDLVICTNCSDAITQAAQLAKEAASYTQSVQSYVRQGLQYANQIQNTISLPMQVWANVQGDVATVRGLATSAGQFSSASGGIGSLFGSVSSYGGQIGNLALMPEKYQQWGGIERTNLDTTLKTLGIGEGQRNADAASLAAAQIHSSTATGQMQALQAGNEIQAVQASQTQKLQEIAAAHMQMDANHYAIEGDRQAIRDAAMTKFLQGPQVAMTVGARY